MEVVLVVGYKFRMDKMLSFASEAWTHTHQRTPTSRLPPGCSANRLIMTWEYLATNGHICPRPRTERLAHLLQVPAYLYHTRYSIQDHGVASAAPKSNTTSPPCPCPPLTTHGVLSFHFLLSPKHPPWGSKKSCSSSSRSSRQRG